ncbi:hypothetical protein K458DRAFT_457419 [Lentithecium fluviatile CBS 122367]|uniref:TPR-like protein n=1 Tax=Lentithecium fluviatile CBS 122367 TaxID=1168545 RepID=A0A6G1ISW7_9PLEO|nr:hypothetical protein K458DRAFT_457419 [Lentithecium fluviatile CBS 122367]
MAFLNAIRVLIKYSFVTANPSGMRPKQILQRALEGRRTAQSHANAVLEHAWSNFSSSLADLDTRTLNQRKMELFQKVQCNESDQRLNILYHPLGVFAGFCDRVGEKRRITELMKIEYEYLKSSLGETENMTLVVGSGLSWQFYQMNDGQRGKEMAKKSLKGQIFRPNSREACSAMTSLTANHYLLDEFEDCIDIDTTILECFSAIYGPNDLDALYDEAYRRYEVVLDLKHPQTLKAAAEKHGAFRRDGNYKDTADIQLQLLRTYGEIYGSGHLNTLDQAEDLLSDYENLGDFREVEANLVELVKNIRDGPHSNPSRLAHGLILLAAECLSKLKETFCVDSIVDLALQQLRKDSKLSNGLRIRFLGRMVDLYRNQPTFGSLLAVTGYLNSLKLGDNICDEEATMRALGNAAIALSDDFDMFREARPILSQVHEFLLAMSTKHIEGPEAARSSYERLSYLRDHASELVRQMAIDSLREVAFMKMSKGSSVNCERMLLECLEAYRKFDKMDISIAYTLVSLAELLDGVRILRENSTDSINLRRNWDATIRTALERLGTTYFALNDFSNATETFLQVCEQYSSTFNDQNVGVGDVLLWAAITCICAGEFDRAKYLPKRALERYQTSKSTENWRFKCAQAVQRAVLKIESLRRSSPVEELQRNHFLPPG